jgi:predicted dehydrogenase
MGRAVRWGVLSTAHINDKVLAGASASPDVDVVAVASRDGRRAEEYAARKGISTAHDSYEALLADDTVDAVYVPLPNGLHHEWTMQALRAGKHVLCEKPYSRRPHEVTEAFDEAEQRGLVLSEAFMYRYSPQIRELTRQVLEAGVIGDIKLIVSSFSWPTPPTGDVAWTLRSTAAH